MFTVAVIALAVGVTGGVWWLRRTRLPPSLPASSIQQPLTPAPVPSATVVRPPQIPIVRPPQIPEPPTDLTARRTRETRARALLFQGKRLMAKSQTPERGCESALPMFMEARDMAPWMGLPRTHIRVCQRALGMTPDGNAQPSDPTVEFAP